jgi:hypothetical protein
LEKLEKHRKIERYQDVLDKAILDAYYDAGDNCTKEGSDHEFLDTACTRL